MSKKPLIGVLGATAPRHVIGMHIPMMYANDAYCQSVSRAGGIPLIIPCINNTEDEERLLALCDGFLFPGGEDVDPRLYGEGPHAKLGSVNIDSDIFCIRALNYAQKNNKPILGICRGLQLINVGLKGTLYQDLEEYSTDHYVHLQKQNRDYPIHEITVQKNTFLHKIIGKEKIYTNSFHHQSVKKVAPKLSVSATTGDGVIEALENEDGSIIIVQFHPEELSDSVPETRNLFSYLIEQARK